MRTFSKTTIKIAALALVAATISPHEALAAPRYNPSPHTVNVYWGQPTYPRPGYYPAPRPNSNQLGYLAQNLERSALHLYSELNSLGENHTYGLPNGVWSGLGHIGGAHGEIRSIRSLVARFSYTAAEFRNSVDRRSRGYNRSGQLLRTLNNLASDISRQFDHCGHSLRHAEQDWQRTQDILFRINSVAGSHDGSCVD